VLAWLLLNTAKIYNKLLRVGGSVWVRIIIKAEGDGAPVKPALDVV
jgi:hypothetical protein